MDNRILIVDDDDDSTFILSSHLGKLGFDCDIVPGGQEAVDY